MAVRGGGWGAGAGAGAGYSADNLQLVLCLVITAHSKQARDGSELGAGVGNILILNGE